MSRPARRQALEGLVFYGDGDKNPGPVRRSPDALHDLYPGARLGGPSRALADERALLPKLDGPQWEVTLTFDRGRLARARGDLARAESVLPPVSGGARQRRPSRQVRRTPAAGGHLRRTRRSGCGRARGGVGLRRAQLPGAPMLTDRQLRLPRSRSPRSEYQVSLPPRASSARAWRGCWPRSPPEGGRSRAFSSPSAGARGDLMDGMARAAGLRAHPSETATNAHAAPLATGPLSATAIAALIPDDRTAILEYVTGASGGAHDPVRGDQTRSGTGWPCGHTSCRRPTRSSGRSPGSWR